MQKRLAVGRGVKALDHKNRGGGGGVNAHKTGAYMRFP